MTTGIVSEASGIQEDLYDLPIVAISHRTPITIPPCDVCQNTVARPVYQVTQTRFEVVQCTSCGLGLVFPEPTLEELSSFYPAAYYGSGGKKFSGLVEWLVRLVGSRHARFLSRHVPPGGRILDVGCGRGVTLRSLANAGFEAHGFEVSQDAVRGVDPRVKIRVAGSLPQADYPEAFFDKIVIWHVLEHVQHPREVLLECHRILKPGGRLVVAVPNFSSLQSKWAKEAWFHLDLPRHLYHFPLSALQQLVAACGFETARAHHFSLRQNPFGWIQSCLNKTAWQPRNGLYRLLHRRHDGSTPPFDARTRWLLKFCLIALSPWAVGMSVFAAAIRSGATIHLVAKKPSSEKRTRQKTRSTLEG